MRANRKAMVTPESLSDAIDKEVYRWGAIQQTDEWAKYYAWYRKSDSYQTDDFVIAGSKPSVTHEKVGDQMSIYQSPTCNVNRIKKALGV